MDTYINSTVFESATTLFAAAVTLMVLVTGFFVGRSWMSKAGMDTDAADDSNAVPIYVNSEGQSEWAIDGSTTMEHGKWAADAGSDFDSTPY